MEPTSTLVSIDWWLKKKKNQGLYQSNFHFWTDKVVVLDNVSNGSDMKKKSWKVLSFKCTWNADVWRKNKD